MTGPFYLMPGGRFPVQLGVPVLVTRDEYEDCCCPKDWCKIEIFYVCAENKSGASINGFDNCCPTSDITIPTYCASASINVPGATLTLKQYLFVYRPSETSAITIDNDMERAACWVAVRHTVGTTATNTIIFKNVIYNTIALAIAANTGEFAWITHNGAESSIFKMYFNDTNCNDNRRQVLLDVYRCKEATIHKWTGYRIKTASACETEYETTVPSSGTFPSGCDDTWYPITKTFSTVPIIGDPPADAWT